MGSKAFNGEVWTNVHPDIMQAMLEANSVAVDGKVGNDGYSKRAEALMQAQFTGPVYMFETINGTAANTLALKCMLRTWSSVLCADETHINTYECAAFEYNLRGKLISAPSHDGKLTPEQVAGLLEKSRRFGYVPTVLALTQPTEFGVLYTVEELAALTELAHKNGLYVYIDGARIANALEALDTDLHTMIEQTDVDAFTFGGTKCGALFGEMVVLRRPEHAEHLDYIQKQSLQHLDKSKFLGAQLEYLLEGERWRSIAGHANAMAALLARRLAEKDVELCFSPDVNMVFTRLSREQFSRVTSVFDLHWWDETEGSVRFCATHETTVDLIERLLELI